jgi:hypothetical protein
LLVAPAVALLLGLLTSLVTPLHLTFGTLHVKAGVQEVGEGYLPTFLSPRYSHLRAGRWMYYFINWTTPHSVASVSRRVRRGVRTGAREAEVMNWLKSQGIEHRWEGVHESDRHERFPYQREALSGMVTGRIRETNYDFLMSGDLVLDFLFDRNGTLIDSSVHEEWLGP